MLYDKTNLPEDLKMYLREIYSNEELNDVFYDCDIEIFDEDAVKDFEDDEVWLDDLMGPGDYSYTNLKPFARDGSGAMWVLIDDKMIAYIGTEGECGFVARNIHEFMNIVSVWGGYICDYWKKKILKNKDKFYEVMNDPNRLADYDFIESHKRVFKPFIEKHGFTKDIYEMALAGMSVEPVFEVKATSDEYVDSEPLVREDY